MVFHALNRGVGKMKVFWTDRDYLAFEETIEQTLRLYRMRVLAYCLMPNHWHFVLWPENDGDLSAFLQRLTNTHTQRWQRAKNKVGHGHLYQGRFKSFPVETDDHFYRLVRYVERNALRANLVEAAESWRWGSLWRRVEQVRSPLLSVWPLPEARNWLQMASQPQAEGQVNATCKCIQRGRLFGGAAWFQRTGQSLGMDRTLPASARAGISRSKSAQPPPF